jgi:hypothetical protein
MLNITPLVLKRVHFSAVADALVLVADSDMSPVHDDSHDPGDQGTKCRLCLLHQAVAATRRGLRPVAGSVPVKVAIGLAVPTIEAWLLCGKESGVGEAAWQVAVQGRKLGPLERANLKKRLYGMDRPSLELETEKMVEEASRLSQRLALLVQSFPAGFGALYRDLVGWHTHLPNPAEGI